MGRTQLSTTILHSIFREKTFGASTEGLEEKKEILQRKYWALVFGSPRRRQGNISLPLGKVVMDDGKSERITVVDNADNMPSQHAITEYRDTKASTSAAQVGDTKASTPPLQPPGSLDGVEMFGFTLPAIVQVIQKMDHNRVSTEYWKSRTTGKIAEHSQPPSSNNENLEMNNVNACKGVRLLAGVDTVL